MPRARPRSRVGIITLIGALACTICASALGADAAVRLVLSFGTPCCTLDPTMPPAVATHIESFEREHDVKLARQHYVWGDNGEANWCFELTELAPDAQRTFVAGLRELTARSARTFVREHEPCTTHSRVPRR